MQTPIKQRACSAKLVTFDERNQESVLDHFALSMAAADTHHLVGNWLQDAHAACVVGVSEGLCSSADGRDSKPLRKLALLKPPLQLADPLLEARSVASRCCDKSHMHVCERNARLRKAAFRVSCRILPY